jgi:hypothetical protein
MNSKAIILLTAVVAFAGSAIAAEPAKRKPESTITKPLTYANVVAFFKEARLRPTDVQKRCTVFFEGEWKGANSYNYCLVIVENSDEDVQVTFYLTDAHEMNWVTEFVEGPFFTRSETQRLFALMNAGRDAGKKQVGRFRVDFHRWEPRHAQIIVFSFTGR